MLDKYLIFHCSPTLASIKTANLFRLTYTEEADLRDQLTAWNENLGQKGISLVILQKKGRTALIYVYRKTRLQADLQKPGVAEFLSSRGYLYTDTDHAVAMLRRRLEKGREFPHEIGLFLGYPLEDVTAFIKNGGKNSICTGCWKVYYNEQEAKRMFAKFRKCRDVYLRLWNQGKTVRQLTVAV